MHVAKTLRTERAHFLTRGVPCICHQLVSPGLRDLVVEAGVALEDDLLGLRLEEPPLTRMLGAEHMPADLLKQQEAPVRERRRGGCLARTLARVGSLPSNAAWAASQ